MRLDDLSAYYQRNHTISLSIVIGRSRTRLPAKLFIDSSCIKVHRTAGGARVGPWLMVSASPNLAGTPGEGPRNVACCCHMELK